MTQRIASKTVNIVRSTAITVLANAVYSTGAIPCDGFNEVVGTIHCAAGATAAAGYPRVVFLSDQAATGTAPTGVTNPSQTYVLGQDTSQPNVSFPINVNPIQCPYIAIEFKDGGGGSTIDEIFAELRGS